jgi:hypothetical protein
MLLLLATDAPYSARPVRAEVQATANARIERAATASRKAWEQSPKASRREIIVRDERGQSILIRVIEYQ